MSKISQSLKYIHTYQGYPAKRVLPAMLTHGRSVGPFWQDTFDIWQYKHKKQSTTNRLVCMYNGIYIVVLATNWHIFYFQILYLWVVGYHTQLQLCTKTEGAQEFLSHIVPLKLQMQEFPCTFLGNKNIWMGKLSTTCCIMRNLCV